MLCIPRSKIAPKGDFFRSNFGMGSGVKVGKWGKSGVKVG